MTYKIYKITSNKEELIKNVASIDWSDDLGQPFVSFSFETTEKINLGARVKLCAQAKKDAIINTVFSGIITKFEKTNNKFLYSGFDYKNCSNSFVNMSTFDDYFKDSISLETKKDDKTSSLMLLGDWQIRGGVIFPHKNENPKFDMTYLIKASSHNFDMTNEIVKVDIVPFVA